ncbi:NUDIX hydrolase [Gryllotalpicola protaetiae]|uniref:NUDIX domain-containing protein n=1 Tax=Gryllotalpicola protaetiae TaxID=2419771 RepID=A0A387BR68_9MICO|nr:NUDIX hydrolase [Gryllotalpicola protaetiae]AYG03560.1 NUDIX domain-containing protein [Gryllotalpicola protaetiae]
MALRVAAYCIIIEDGKMLLSHWNENGSNGWTLPGGGLDPYEDPADAAVREVFEETGYRAELGELLGIDSHLVAAEHRFQGATEPLQALRIVYRARVVGGELTNELDGSTDEAAWFDLAEVAKLKRVGLVEVGLKFAGIAL